MIRKFTTALHITIILLASLLWGQQASASDDYVMACTFEQSREYRVYSVSSDGGIFFTSKQSIATSPYKITFAPNGKWGMIGCRTSSIPESQYSVLLRVDKQSNVHLWDYLFNEYHVGYSDSVTIDQNSSIGVYGINMNTIKILNNNQYTINYNNTPVDNYDFLSSMKIIARSGLIGYSILSEYTIREDGTTTPTGVTVDIAPSSGNAGICVSPDGKTAIVISGVGADVTVIRVNGDGDFSIVQQFGYQGDNHGPSAVHFSQNSSLVAIRYVNFISIYAVSYDSRLTEISRASIPYPGSGHKMGVTHDFRIAVATYRVWVNGIPSTFFYVFRIHENGMIEYLPGKDYVCLGLSSDIAFVPPQVTDAEPAWDMYE